MKKYIFLFICLFIAIHFSYADVWNGHIGESVVSGLLVFFLGFYSIIFIVIYLILRISSKDYRQNVAYKIYNFVSFLLYVLIILNAVSYLLNFYNGRFRLDSRESQGIWFFVFIILAILIGFTINVSNLVSIFRNRSSDEKV